MACEDAAGHHDGNDHGDDDHGHGDEEHSADFDESVR